MSSQTFPKTRGRNTSNFFFFFNKASITLTWKPDETATRKLQANIPKEHKCKNPQQKILETKFNIAGKGSYSSWIYSRDTRWFNICKSMWFTRLTEWRIKPKRPSQQILKKYLTKFNIIYDEISQQKVQEHTST